MAASPDPAVPRSAATVVLVRERQQRLEVAIVRRHADLRVAGGAIAFPGGSVDARDVVEAETIAGLKARVDGSAAAAAVRECAEEIAVVVAPQALWFLSRWVTPAHLEHRFDTHFFVAVAEADSDSDSDSDAPFRPDGQEVVEAWWSTPSELLDRTSTEGLLALPPTVRTLQWLDRLGSVAAVIAEVQVQYEPKVISPRVRRLRAPNAGVMTGAGTNSYIVGTEDFAVIDPGPDDQSHTDALARLVTDRLRYIVLTHHHPDHVAGAMELASRTGASIVAGGAMSDVAVDRILGDGEELELHDATLRVMATPGHTADHLCLVLTAERLLFSGDHIMEGSTVAIQPPDGDMAAYFESLEAVRKIGVSRGAEGSPVAEAPVAEAPVAPRVPSPEIVTASTDLLRIAPGHGEILEDPRAVIDDYLRHRRERERQVLAAVRDGPRTPESVAQSLYDLPDVLRPMAANTVWAHLRKLAGEGLVHSDRPDDRSCPWVTVH